MVRACFRRLGLYGFLDGLKEKGVPLSYVVELMCVYQLNGGSSMNEYGALSGSVLVKEELCHGHTISRKTIERGLSLLDLYFEDYGPPATPLERDIPRSIDRRICRWVPHPT